MQYEICRKLARSSGSIMNALNRSGGRPGMICYVVSLIASIGLLIWSMKLYSADVIHLPFSYSGDSLFFYAQTKTMIDNGWVLHNSFLGAPYELDMYDFPFNNTLDMLIIKFISLFIHDHILVTNLFFLLTFPLTTLTSMIVFRKFEIGYPYAILGSLLFTFIPYHLIRGVGHLNLSPYFIVPLMVMVLLWIYSNEIAINISDNSSGIKSLMYNYKLMVSILICILSGVTYFYYPYFFCFFLMLVGIISSAIHRQKAPILISILMIMLIVLVIILNQSPTIIYHYQYGANPGVTTRSPQETEIYGLKIIQLLLPINGHRIPIFSSLTDYYDRTAPLVNENSAASLGIIGSVGFFILIAYFFLRGNCRESILNYDSANLGCLSVLNLSAVLFATIGGFSSLIAYTVLAQFRGINRISIFIAFFSIFSILIVLKYLTNTHIKSNKSIYFIAVLLLVVGIFDQTSNSLIPPYASIKGEYVIDEKFIDRVEDLMPENAMIFQMPYAPFPQYPPINKMTEFSHLRGYLHSKDLRWSYGSMMGRPEDDWQKLVASMPLMNMIETLSQFGFDGIYVDSYGFGEGDIGLLSNITRIIGVEPIVSDNLRLYFFDMTGYNQRPKTPFLENKSMTVAYNSGWHDIEDWSGASIRWMEADSTIIFISPENQTLNLNLDAQSFYRKRIFEIYSGDGLVAQAEVPDHFVNVVAPIRLAKGVNIVRLHVPDGCERPCDNPDLNNPDSRCLSVAVKNLNII